MTSNNRFLGILLVFPLLLLVIFLGKEFLRYGMLILSTMAILEFYDAFKNKEINSYALLGVLFNLIYYTLILGRNSDEKLTSFFFIASFMICLCVSLFSEKNTIMDSIITYIALVYITVPYGLVYLINKMSYGNLLVWLSFITCWSCDSLAFYFGRIFGKRKLCERISPKKTVEGAIGGIIGSVLVCIIFSIIFSKTVQISLIHFLTIGIITGIVGQMGDLIASLIKRYNGIKDFSNLIPGHGGILDRFDSVILTNIAVYFYLSLILNL